VNKELIIKTSSEAVDFALLKDGKLIELHREASENSFSVGDIFLAKVRKPVSGLNAAFVNVGHQKDAFFTLSRFRTSVQLVDEIHEGPSTKEDFKL